MLGLMCPATISSSSSTAFRINQKFNPPTPLGVEWEESSTRHTDSLLAISMINWTHPGYYRRLPVAIQQAIVGRLLGCLGTRNVCLDGGIRCTVQCAQKCTNGGKCEFKNLYYILKKKRKKSYIFLYYF